MDKITFENIISFFNEQLSGFGIKPHKLIIFGSASDGSFNENSDVDIAIISDDFLNVDIFERSLLTSKAERETMRKFGIPLDVVRLTKAEYENDERLIVKYVKKNNSIF